mgnify:CR=1 FL=1
MTYRLDVSVVREAARGHWDAIFCALAPMLKAAMQQPGKHVPCPVHGGKDGFRLFPDYAEAGSCVCNTCGSFRDGFETLEWLHGWGFAETLKRVSCVLGLQPRQGEEVVAREMLNRSYRGHILSMGTPSVRQPRAFEGFLVEIDDEISNSVRKLGTRSLKRTLAEAGVKPHERVEIVLAARERVRRADGFSCTRYVWCVKRLMSKAQEQLFSAEKAQLNGQLAGAIRSRWLNALRFDASDPEQKPLQLYLQRRVIADVDESFLKDLRFERKFFDCESRQWHPTMLAAVRDVTGQLVTVHRTLLTGDGHKADVNVPKRLMRLPDDRTINGCAIRFGEPHEVLALAEGIETALSVTVATGIPCWSCINAGCLERVAIPNHVKRVLIFADRDRSGTGERSASMLAQRLEALGVAVSVVAIRDEIPDGADGIDFNDLLCRDGKDRIVSMLP